MSAKQQLPAPMPVRVFWPFAPLDEFKAAQVEQQERRMRDIPVEVERRRDRLAEVDEATKEQR